MADIAIKTDVKLLDRGDDGQCASVEEEREQEMKFVRFLTL